MKRLFYFLIVLSCTLWSCGKSDSDIDDPNNPDNPDNPTNITLDISTTDLTFEASGGQKEFTIYCNSDWTITSNSTWCKTDVNNGNGDKTITVTADPYSETEDQNTNLTIKAGDKTQVLTVTQKHGDAIILTKDKFDIPQEGDNITIEVKSNIKYQVSIPYKFQSWIKEAVKSKAVTTKNFSFTISANEDFDKREGYIVFSGNSLKDTVYVYQAQKNQLILTEDIYNIPAEGKDITVELKTNVDYEVTIPNDAVTWLFQVTTRAIRTDQLKFHIDFNKGANNRSAKVLVKDKNSELSDTIYISQLPLGEIKLSQKVFNIEAVGGDISTILTTNVDYEVLIPYQYQDWITKLEAEIAQTIELKFKIAANTTTDKRTGKIIIKDKNSILSDTIIVNQLAEENTYWGDIEFKSAQEIQTFIQKGYTNIQGNVKISDYNTTTLIAFADALEYISGNLEITCSRLTSLTGLSGLKKIDGNLLINDCKIENMQGLNELKEVGGNFILYGCFRNLSSFDGLNKLEKIGNDFRLTYQSYNELSHLFSQLRSFEGLNNLIYIGGELYLEGSYKNSFNNLISFDGLAPLKVLNELHIGGDRYYKTSFLSLKSFPMLANIKTMSHIYIEALPTITVLNELENLQSCKSLAIVDCDKLQSISLNNLTNIQTLSIAGKEDQHILLGLSNLQTIDGNVSIENTSIEGINNLHTVTGDLCLGYITNFNPLHNLKYIGGNLKLTDINAISLEGLENITTLKSLSIIRSKLESLRGLDNLTQIDGDFEIQASPLPSLKGLGKLEYISGNVLMGNSSAYYYDGPLISSFQGCENLTTIGGKLEIFRCTQLTSLSGLDKLSQINKDFIISECSKLEDINILSTLNKVQGGNFKINNCPTLYDFTSLKNALTDYKGIFELTNNGYNPTKYQILNGQGKPQE